MIKNIHRENLQNLLDEFYCGINEPNQRSLFWSYNDKTKVEDSYIEFDGKKTIKDLTNMTGTPIESIYEMILIECIKDFEIEIGKNINSLLKQDKIEYIESIVSEVKNRILSLNSILDFFKKNQKKASRFVYDKDKIFPVQLMRLSDLLVRLKSKYILYLEDKSQRRIENEAKENEISLSQQKESQRQHIYNLVSKKDSEKSNEQIIGFADIFVNGNWKIYIDALYKVEDPLIDKEYNYIGKQRNDKGVVCSWIHYLKLKHIIKKRFTRQELAKVLNSEIKDFNLGKDGKTFDNESENFNKNYKEKLIKLIE